jgi:L-threonylcarbamoyladenylate synthase
MPPISWPRTTRSISALAVNPPDSEILYAARVIRDGGIVIHATEYCFGLACDPHNIEAIARLLRLKQRVARKGLILLAADIDQIAGYVTGIPSHVADTWPGPHTWLLEPTASVPRWITGAHDRVALRVTAHPQAAALARAAGPIVSTSANRTGEHPCRRYREALQRLGAEVDYVLPGRVGNLPAPTPIRDASTRRVIRPG